MKVTIIGSGNVATVLGRKILASQNEIVEVISKHQANAVLLAEELKAKNGEDIKTINHDSDLYMIAVNDSAVTEVANSLRLDKGIVVHTSGSVSKNVLQDCSEEFGVLYPLQSLRKEIITTPVIPLLVDGNDFSVTKKIFDFAEKLSSQVHEANDEKRLQLHLAAVIVSNFTNHLFTLAEDYCKKAYLNFSFLLPLIQETLNRVSNFSPSQIQTGPAIRGDESTIAKHLELLENFPDLKNIYLQMSESIIKKYAIDK